MNRTVRFTAIALAALFILPTFLTFVHDSSVQAGIVQVTVFDGGLTDSQLGFISGTTNTTLGFKIPKASVVKSFTMDLEAVKATAPGQILLDTKEDFEASNPVNLNTTKVYGNAYLIEKPNLSDEFNDGILDANWSWVNPPGSVLENLTSGELEMTTIPDTNWWNGDLTSPFLYKEVDGNFMVETKVSTHPDENYEKVGIVVWLDNNNYMLIVYRWIKVNQQDPGRRYIASGSRVNGQNVDSQNNIPMTANPLWLRVTRHFNEFKTYYSNNGQVFTEHRTFTLNWGTNLRVGLMTSDGHANNATRADFDYFRMGRFVENGTLNVGPFTTPYPVGRINMDSDLEQLKFWEDFEVRVRSDPAAPWDVFVSGGDHTLSQAGTDMEVEVYMDGKGWTTPTLKSVKVDYYPESWPSAVEIDLGNDGSVEWNWTGTFSQSTNINSPGFIAALESLKDSLTADGEGYVHIPMKVTSQTPGYINFKNLVFELFTGSAPDAPELLSPVNDIWISTLTPSFSFKTEDPDADTLMYKIELSTDNFATRTHTFDQTTDKFSWSETEYLSEEVAKFEMYSSNQLQHGKIYKWRVAAFDGGWWSNYSLAQILKVDVTLPSGKITDAGSSTAVNRKATATVTFTDAESGISEIEVGLGTAKNKTDVAPMTKFNHTNGVAPVTFTGLALQDMKTYYFTARAKNGAEQWSMNFTSDGIKIDLSLDAPPTVEVLNPTNRSTVVQTITISGTASDPDPGDTFDVLVAIDDNAFEEALGDTTWSHEWDTTTVPDGEHTIYVKADDGKRESPTVIVPVLVGNNRVSIISWSPIGDQTINELESIDFSIEIKDPAGIFKSYTWLVDGINVPNLDNKDFTYQTDYDDAGVRVIEAKAMGVGSTATHKWNVTVLNVNRNPVAIITAPKNKASVDVGSKVWFDGTGSSDPDKDKLTYEWEFSDGKTETGSKISRKFNKAGDMKATLTVKDPNNGTSSAEVKLTVTEETDIITTFTTMPVCLVPLLILIVIIAVVVAVVMGKKKRTQQFEAKLIDEELTSPITHYDPTPKEPGMEGQPQAPEEAPAPEPEAPAQAYQQPPPKAQAPPQPAPATPPGPEPEPEAEVTTATATTVSEPKPDVAPEEYSVIDEEASKSGPVWGKTSYDDDDEGGDKPSGPAWTQKSEDDDGEGAKPAGPAWAMKKDEDED